MREKIYASIRIIDTRIFTGAAIIGAVILTTGLNALFSWIAGETMRPQVVFFATLDAILIPLVLAPIFIRLFKRAANLEQINQELHLEISERQQAEQTAQQRALDLEAVNEFAVACAGAEPDTDINQLLAERLAACTKALAVVVNTYDPPRQSLVVRHVTASHQVLAAVNALLGRNVIGMTIPLKAKAYQQIVTNAVEVLDDLTQVSFGAIPQPVSALIQKTFGIGRFQGLALINRNELWGAAMLVLHANQPPVNRETALAYSNVAAVAMRRHRAEQTLHEQERQLRASEEKYRLIAENVADIIWTTDMSFQFHYISPSVENVRGYTVQEAMRQRLEQIFTPASLELAMQVFGEELAKEQESPVNPNRSRLIELEEYCKDGSTIWTENRITFLRDEHLAAVGIIGITRNITERKNAERERESLIAQLESKNIELERFTYTVSHDLRSPLITIRGFLGFLDKDIQANDVERARTDIDRLNQATSKMQTLLDELLSLSRVGRMMNPPTLVPFASIAREAMGLVGGRLDARRIRVEILPDLPTVYGDRLRLVQVVQNLIDNAAKFMGDQPEPCITIGKQSNDGDGKPILFVRDNGIGIDPEHHERVFGLFNKLDAQSEGTGLGLALVKRIIEVHGGRIWVESDGEGKGTTFLFTLPTES